VIVMHVDYLKI